MFRSLSISVLAVGFLVSSAWAGTVPVLPSSADWTVTNYVRPAGSIAITSVNPRGLGTGSLEIKFDGTNSNAKGDAFKQILSGSGFGKLSDLDSLSFDWYRDSSSTVPAHYAPVLRLGVYDPTSGKSSYLIWEATYNGFGSTVPTNSWQTSTITGQYFWQWKFPGVYEDFDLTLADWSSTSTPSGANPVGPNAIVYELNVGAGSGWAPGTFHGFVDNITIGFNGVAKTYDFETRVVPLPAAAWGGLGLMGALGVARVIRPRKQA